MNRWVMLGCCLLGLSACRQVVDFDEPQRPGDSREQADGGAADAGASPWQPNPLASEQCTRCIDAACSTEREACDASDFCADFIRDLQNQKVEGPGIASADLTVRWSMATWDLLHGDDRPAAFDALRRCVYNTCGRECGPGRDFSCIGQFSYPRNSEPETQVRLQLVQAFTNAPLADLPITMCDPALPDCGALLGKAVTDEGGFAIVTADFSMFESTFFTAPSSAAYFRLNGDAHNLVPYEFWLSRPFYQDEFASFSVWDRDQMKQNTDARVGSTWDESHALLAIQPYDCAGDNARNVEVELWTFDSEAMPSRFTDCNIVYSDEFGLADPSLDHVSDTGANLGYAFSLGPTLVVVRDIPTRRVVSAYRPSILAIAGHVDALQMYPASREQLARIPQAVLHP